MASKPPPSLQPTGVPTGGNGKYIAIALLLFGGIGAVIVWKMMNKPETPTTPVTVFDAGLPPPKPTGRNPDEDVPPPPVAEDAGEDSGKKPVATTVKADNGCEAKKCTGAASSEIEQALSFRAKQAHRCYDQALAQDSSLRGKVSIALRIGNNGSVCSAGVASNEMGSSTVASCVANYFRGSNFPSPKGGCVDVNIPINFVPRQ